MTLAAPAPMIVPAIPKYDRSTVVLTAASALATTCVSESFGASGAFASPPAPGSLASSTVGPSTALVAVRRSSDVPRWTAVLASSGVARSGRARPSPGAPEAGRVLGEVVTWFVVRVFRGRVAVVARVPSDRQHVPGAPRSGVGCGRPSSVDTRCGHASGPR